MEADYIAFMGSFKFFLSPITIIVAIIALGLLGILKKRLFK